MRKQGNELQEIECAVYLVFPHVLSDDRLSAWFGEKAPKSTTYEPDEDLQWSSLVTFQPKAIPVEEGLIRDPTGLRLRFGGSITKTRTQLLEYYNLARERGVDLDKVLAYAFLAVREHLVLGSPKEKYLKMMEGVAVPESEKTLGCQLVNKGIYLVDPQNSGRKYTRMSIAPFGDNTLMSRFNISVTRERIGEILEIMDSLPRMIAAIFESGTKK